MCFLPSDNKSDIYNKQLLISLDFHRTVRTYNGECYNWPTTRRDIDKILHGLSYESPEWYYKLRFNDVENAAKSIILTEPAT